MTGWGMTSETTENNFGFLFADTARLMRKQFAQRARNVNLTGAQWRVLAYLSRMPGVKQATLADLLEVEPITLTRLLDRMEATGLVRRDIDPHDRRVRNIYATEKATPLMEELRAISLRFQADIFDGIPEAELQAAMATIARIRTKMLDVSTDCDP
ncbi:MarR family winged helix-turn-helix transcriptional regulator [Govanella unica]|uniref:MarR family transcriptional regulator n=1 Tax=Govanella unica TaxID=2975056 RepID=A0A9X3TYG0_9PROT|nr:MarR family transcriptional regulator [Govania unica]MDA5194054.1 MarR family transcriptional regulator [Govania unica]